MPLNCTQNGENGKFYSVCILLQFKKKWIPHNCMEHYLGGGCEESCMEMASVVCIRDHGDSEEEEGHGILQRKMEFHSLDALLFLFNATSFSVSHQFTPCTH